VLVLSAAVLVIVIDARDVGPWGWRAGFNTKHAEITKVFGGGWCAHEWPRNDTDDHGKEIGSCSCSAQRCS